MFNKKELLQKIQGDIYTYERQACTNTIRDNNPIILKYKLDNVNDYELAFRQQEYYFNNHNGKYEYIYDLILPETEHYDLLYIRTKGYDSLYAVIHRYLTYYDKCKTFSDGTKIFSDIDDDFEEFLFYVYGDFTTLTECLKLNPHDLSKNYFSVLRDLFGVDKLKEIIEDLVESEFYDDIFKLEEDDKPYDNIEFNINSSTWCIKDDVLYDCDDEGHQIDKHFLLQFKDKGYNFDIQKTLDHYKEEQIKLIQNIIDSKT